MTISTEVRKAGPFVGNGSASVFPFAFKVFRAADLIVVRRQDNIGEETTLVLDSDYHVTLNGNQDTTPGGVVTLVAGALASGFTLVVSSELPYLQPTDLTNQGGFYPKVITNALDRLTIFCQQLAEITGRTLKLPITAPTNISAEIPLPNPSELIAWNETGTGLTTVSPQSLVTSIAYGSATADLFAGDGVTTTFPLSTNPASVNNLDVSVGGFSQRPVQGGIGDYSWNGGASITFTSPPPAPSIPGDKNVLVRYMQAIPVSDSEALHAQTREALRRSYAEAGYNLVDGSFETGGTLASTSDVLLLESAGAAYAWTGVYPVGGYVVAPSIDPTVVPGFALRTEVVLRDGLTSLGSSIDDIAGFKSLISSGHGSGNVGYNRGAANCLDITAAKKFLAIRHCSDWGILCDGSDETAKLAKLVTDINAIPNPHGHPVHVVFSGQSDLSTAVLKFTSTKQFTRPVHLDGGREVYINYTGTGNAFEFGPDGLTGNLGTGGDTNLHKYYSVTGFGAYGGVTDKACFYFKPWVLYPRVTDCRFEAFGGNGSCAVYCQYNNWSVYVSDCEFWGKTDSTSDNTNKRNFVCCPGALTDGTRDEFATRLNAIDNWVYSGGWTAGGIAYLVSGWKSRIQGGGIEGPYTGVIIGAGCNDVEISGCYWESVFANTPVPRAIQLSYAGDPYFPAYPHVKRLKIHDMYCNMHNTDSLASNGRFLLCANNVKLIDPVIKISLVHSGFPVLELPDIAGHRVHELDVLVDGNFAAQSFISTTAYASLNKPKWVNRIKNFAKVFDFSTIVSGISGAAAPLNASFGISDMTLTSNGTGGSYTATKIASDNTPATGYERYKVSQQLNYGSFQCVTVPSGQTYVTLNISLDADLLELQGHDVIVTFLAKAYNNPVLVKAIHNFTGPGISTEAINAQTVAVGDWFQYAFKISVPEIPVGTTVSSSAQSITLSLPAGKLFSFAMAGLMVHVGQMAIPIEATA